ncbi:MAG: CBS domain-containing protein [Candidatus Dormibacterales bacterium]
MPRHRTVGEVMTNQVHVAGPQTPFKLLVRLIEENKVSAIPIVDQDGTPVGIVSEADLLLKERRRELESRLDPFHPQRRRTEKAKAEGSVASELMTSPPLTISADATLTEAARLMQERNIRRLIVVDARGKIAGVVSRSDLLQVFLRGDEEFRDEILGSLVPAVLLTPDEPIEVEVRYNVVTLKGVVDRKSDAQILTRKARELDGVVEVVDRLTYRWDDTAAPAAGPLVGGSLRTY